MLHSLKLSDIVLPVKTKKSLKKEIEKMKLKKLLIGAVCATTAIAAVASASACGNNDKIYVDTNAYFAPFEYLDENLNIVGVDVEIMNKVGEKLGKEVVFDNTEFNVIIDNVASGKRYDCGAAGITITEARKQQVDFSNPYFTSIQYVICQTGALTSAGTSTDGANVQYVLWSQLAGKMIGVQRDTTGDIYVDAEMGTYENDAGETVCGELCNPETQEAYAGTELKQYSSAQIAVDAIAANQVDVVVVDKLPAQYIVGKNSGYECFALYYDASTATQEDYAICVTKGNTELLNAINEVLAELGEEGINALVSKHLGISE